MLWGYSVNSNFMNFHGSFFKTGLRGVVSKRHPLSPPWVPLCAAGSYRMALRWNWAFPNPRKDRRSRLLITVSIGHLSSGLVGSCEDSCFHPTPGPAAHTCLTPVREDSLVVFTQPRSRVPEQSASHAIRTSVLACSPCSFPYCAGTERRRRDSKIFRQREGTEMGIVLREDVSE